VKASCLQFFAAYISHVKRDIAEAQVAQVAPSVFSLVGENNSLIQSVFWRDAFFTLTKEFPESWETINIKKGFLPKLQTALKNAGFGASQVLYENVVKLYSVFPMFQLANPPESKQNKASFKDRVNMLRESFQWLYEGMKGDEAPAYHNELARSFFECFTFVLLKRVGPFIEQEGTTPEDKQFLEG